LLIAERVEIQRENAKLREEIARRNRLDQMPHHHGATASE
jgi:hypothetical protein